MKASRFHARAGQAFDSYGHYLAADKPMLYMIILHYFIIVKLSLI